MVEHRKPLTSTEVKRALGVYALIFQGIHFRHEFARRNDAVVRDGKLLLKQLGLSPERGRGFVSKSGTFLTDDLRVAVQKSGKLQRRLQTALVRYLKEHGVLPLSEPGQPFFAHAILRPSEESLADGFRLFNSFLHFEAFAMVVCRLGHPVVFPVMPCRHLQVNDRTYRIYESLQLEDYPAPFLVDNAAPARNIGAYLTAVSMHQNISRRREATQADEDGRVRASRLPSERRLSFALRLHDISRTIERSKFKQDGTGVDALDIAERELKPDRPSPSCYELRAKYAKRLLEQAAAWISDYRHIC